MREAAITTGFTMGWPWLLALLPVPWLLRWLLPHPQRFAPLLAIGQTLRPLMPSALRRRVPKRSRAGTWPAPRHARRMLCLDGCVQSSIAPGINAAAARVLDRLGVSVISTPAAGCCGAVSQHLSARDEAREFMRRNVDAWWPGVEQGAEAIIIGASACTAMIKEYGEILADDPVYATKAARVSALARDLSEVIAGEDPRPPTPVLPPALWHPAARAGHSRQRRVDSRRAGTSADERSRCPPLLRLGRHLLDAATGAVDATA